MYRGSHDTEVIKLILETHSYSNVFYLNVAAVAVPVLGWNTVNKSRLTRTGQVCYRHTFRATVMVAAASKGHGEWFMNSRVVI